MARGDCKKGWDVNNASRQSIIIEQAQLIFCSSFVCVCYKTGTSGR